MKETEDCFLKVKNEYLKFLNKEKIFGESREVKIKSLKNFYIPLSYWIENKYKKKEKILYIGLSGGQGSGKTTVANILCIILKKYFKRKILKISIDDYYKTLEELGAAIDQIGMSEEFQKIVAKANTLGTLTKSRVVCII